MHTTEKIENFIRHDLFVFLYQNQNLAEKKEELAHTYHYYYGADIAKETTPPTFAVVRPENNWSLYDKVAVEVLNNLNFDSFTNPDLKRASFSDILVHSVRCEHTAALNKIQTIAQRDNPCVVSFMNLDKAAPEVLAAVAALQKNHSQRVFMGVEVAHLTPEIKNLNVSVLEMQNVAPAIKNKVKP